MNSCAGGQPVTQLLHAAARGEPRATDELLPLVYDELRKLAQARMGQTPPGQTLQATALVHEAYIRLVGSDNQNWDSRGHFFAAAAEAMRRILVDNARRKSRVRHGVAYQHVDIEPAIPLSTDHAVADEVAYLVALDAALTKLATEDGAKAEVVKLRYFAGLTIHETAAVMGISHATVERHWTYARTWLLKQITEDDAAKEG